MKILFRSDASSEIGMGHVMRDLVLAQQYAQDIVMFATQNLPGNANQKIISEGYLVIDLKDNCVENLIKQIKKFEIDMVVFDHYGIDDLFEKKVKDETGVQVLSFDDTYVKHYCDILLNHNISAKEESYKGLVPSSCEMRCGKKYTLIRDEFKEIEHKERKPLKNKQELRVFVSMGGVDNTNITPKIVDFFSTIAHISLEIVTTSSNKHLLELQEKIKISKHATLHVDTNKIAQIMNSCDFAIITPSVSVHEVLFLKIPFIAIKTANNQEDIFDYLMKNHYLALEHFNIDKFNLKYELLKGS